MRRRRPRVLPTSTSQQRRTGEASVDAVRARPGLGSRTRRGTASGAMTPGWKGGLRLRSPKRKQLRPPHFASLDTRAMWAQKPPRETLTLLPSRKNRRAHPSPGRWAVGPIPQAQPSSETGRQDVYCVCPTGRTAHVLLRGLRNGNASSVPQQSKWTPTASPSCRAHLR